MLPVQSQAVGRVDDSGSANRLYSPFRRALLWREVHGQALKGPTVRQWTWWLVVVVSGEIGAGAACVGAVAQAGARPSGGAEILNTHSYLRWHVTLRKPVVLAGQNRMEPLPADRWIDSVRSAAAPAGWRQPDYDDHNWPRSRAAWLRGLACARFSSAAVSLRGKFEVTDPSAVKSLSLSCKYYGGVVVWLNGREIARADVPAGELRPETPAWPYGEDVFLDASGKPIPGDYQRSKAPPAERKDLNARVAGRERKLGPVQVPPAALRKGVNVLALEFHRSPYHPIVKRWYTRYKGRYPEWRTIDVRDISLRAVGTGVRPNTSRPKGFQLWNHDVNDRVTAADYGDPNEPLRPIRIIGARNGSYCGQVVAGSTEPIRSPRAEPTALRVAGGSATIPARNVAVLYGRMDWHSGNYPTWCDGLQPRPPAEVAVDKTHDGAVLPILVRVRVPADARPGEYRGTLRFSAKGTRPVNVPLELYVADWTVPDPADYRTYIGIYQSPTSLALRYGVPEWSEAHWKLLEKSFAFLGRAGNKLVNVLVSEQTQFGNDRGMVYWIKRPEGGYDHDFSVFERYVKLAKKYCKKLDYVVIHVWHSGGWQVRPADQKNTVTVLDPKTGQMSRLQVPTFGTEQSKRFWKPVLDGIRQRLAKLGLADAMCLGILSDGTAPPKVLAAFDEIVPGGARWMRGLHHQTYVLKPYRLRGGGRVVLHEFCYGLGLPELNKKPFPPIWSYRGRPGTAYHRISGHETAATLIWYRTFPEQSLYRNTQGVGRICLDFFNVIKVRGRYRSHIYNRYPHSSCAQRRPSLMKMTWPGPEGPETTVRFEAFCEGVQDAEAAIVLSDAIDNHADLLGPELARQCRQVLVDRVNYCRLWDQMKWAHVYFHMHHYGWQELRRRLYDCAAEVSRKLARHRTGPSQAAG